MEVGEYVRTNKGYIARIKKITELTIICDGIIYPTKNYGFDKQLNKESLKRLKVKSSPNIIDLIEVGDYVNGYLVKDIDYAFDDVVMNNKNARIVPYIDCNKNNYIDDIKSIVTKEQFESMEYKVEE